MSNSDLIIKALIYIQWNPFTGFFIFSLIEIRSSISSIPQDDSESSGRCLLQSASLDREIKV